MENKKKEDSITWASFKNLNVWVGKRQILSNISIHIKFGENIVILGPNGSGKTTFLRLINRSIYPVESGKSSIKLFNKENINIWDLRRRVGFLFREMEERVNSKVSLYDLIGSGFTGTFNSSNSRFLSEENINRIERLLVELNLEDIRNEDFHLLSEGQKRRSLLARALVYEPEILVLDEPFSNLDIKSNSIFNKILERLNNKSVNIIYVTHSLESILPQTNRVLLIKNGKIIRDGTPENLLTSEILSNLYNISIKVIKQGNYWRSIPLDN